MIIPAAAIDTGNPANSIHCRFVNEAENHLRDVLTIAIEHDASRAAVVVFDTRCALSLILTEAYRRCLPTAHFIDFDQVAPQAVLAAFAPLVANDLVILVQSTNFRLEAFRLRVELFKRGLKVMEHPHLARMPGEQIGYYIEALAYDPAYYRGVGYALKARIDRARSAIIDSGGDDDDDNGNGEGSSSTDSGRARLFFNSPFEPAKLNIGHYRDMNNVGGQFPIGEVFTEARDLEAVNGRVRIFIFGDTSFHVNKPERPITLVIEKGRVIDAIDATPAFEEVLARIRADEGEVWLRELGFGMNRAFSAQRLVDDIGTYERMCGIHLSLGAKHGVYNKAQIKRSAARYHIDVFAVTQAVWLDDEQVYRDGAWCQVR